MNKNEMVKLLLTTNEVDPYDTEESVIEVLNKEKLLSIIDNLDLSTLVHEAYNEARSCRASGYYEVDIDATDGELVQGFTHSGHFNIGCYDTYINLISIPTGDGVGDYYKDYNESKDIFIENEHIEYFEELEERNDAIYNEEIEGKMLTEYEMFNAVVEKFDIDIDDLLEEYFKIMDDYHSSDALDMNNINAQIEELYKHAIN